MSAPKDILPISEETRQFLWGIRLNNSRAWFLAHKEEYLRCAYEPMKVLGAQVQEQLLEKYPELELNLRVSRIYRDVRTVRDGRFYRDYLWFSLYRQKEEGVPKAEFYLSVEPEGVQFGLGYYWMPPGMAALYRQRILEHPAEAEALARYLSERPEFQIWGEEYKRSKGEVSEVLKPWFNRKVVSLCCTLDYDHPAVTENRLAEEAVERFSWLMPLYRAFQELEAAWQAGENPLA